MIPTLPDINPEWFPGELEVWKSKEHLPTSQFSEKYRKVTIGSHQGNWDNRVTPYLSEIMDTADLPWVEELVICGPPQSGKTNACINIMLNNLYRSGGNGKFIMFPTESLAKLFYQIRLIPILKKTAPLSVRLFQDDKIYTNSEKITLRDGTFIFPCWGSSASKLSSFPADFVWADEVDKNADLTGNETDPLSLLEDRIRTARRRLILKCSSPTIETGPIWRALQKCLVRKEMHVMCPHCSSFQQMTFEQITWPSKTGTMTKSDVINQPDIDPEFLKSAKIARYVCESCGSLWDDLDRNKAVTKGVWVNSGDTYHARPRSVGFHISGLVCPDISLSDIAAEIIRARNGDPADIRRLYNSFLGTISPGIQSAITVGLDGLTERVEEYGPHIPAEAAVLTAGADVQQDRIEVEVVAWGIGAQSWGMEYTVLYGDTRLPEVWDQLDRHLLRTWEHSLGANIGISRTFIDAGYLPQKVYRFTHGRKGRGIYAIEGAERVDAPEISGPSNRHRAGISIPVYLLGVNRIKSALFGYMALNTAGPGYCHLPATYPANWYDMIRSEHALPVDKGSGLVRWVKRKGSMRNEAIDCRGYALAALLSMRIDIKGMLDALKQQPTAPRQRKIYSEGHT